MQTIGTLTRNPADNARAATGIFENLLQQTPFAARVVVDKLLQQKEFLLNANRPLRWPCCHYTNGYPDQDTYQMPQLNDLLNVGGCCYRDGDSYHGRYTDGFVSANRGFVETCLPGRPELQQICDLAHDQ